MFICSSTERSEILGTAEVDKGEEGNPRNKKNSVVIIINNKCNLITQCEELEAEEEREQKRETMDKNTLWYCTPNLYNLHIEITGLII